MVEIGKTQAQQRAQLELQRKRQQEAQQKQHPASVRKAAEQHWFKAEKDDSFYHYERASIPVNAAADPQREARVQKQVTSNLAMEASKLSSLSPAQQQQYQAVVAQTKNPEGRLALQVLLSDGKLTQAHDKDGATLLDNLNKMANAPLANGVDRKTLVNDVVQEVAFPTTINQFDRGTCSVSSIQILTAMKQPAEYARIIAGLAGPQMEATLKNGEPIWTKEGAMRGEKLLNVDDQGRLVMKDGKPEEIEDKRSLPARLWQPAMMEYGNGDDQTYDNRIDHNSGTGDGGLEAEQLTRVVDGVTGKPSLTINANEKGISNEEKAKRQALILEKVKEYTKAGHPVSVGADWREPGDTEDIAHAILVTGIKGDRVHFVDSSGAGEESMSMKQFMERIQDANIQAFDPNW